MKSHYLLPNNHSIISYTPGDALIAPRHRRKARAHKKHQYGRRTHEASRGQINRNTAGKFRATSPGLFWFVLSCHKNPTKLNLKTHTHTRIQITVFLYKNQQSEITNAFLQELEKENPTHFRNRDDFLNLIAERYDEFKGARIIAASSSSSAV